MMLKESQSSQKGKGSFLNGSTISSNSKAIHFCKSYSFAEVGECFMVSLSLSSPLDLPSVNTEQARMLMNLIKSSEEEVVDFQVSYRHESPTSLFITYSYSCFVEELNNKKEQSINGTIQEIFKAKAGIIHTFILNSCGYKQTRENREPGAKWLELVKILNNFEQQIYQHTRQIHDISKDTILHLAGVASGVVEGQSWIFGEEAPEKHT